VAVGIGGGVDPGEPPGCGVVTKVVVELPRGANDGVGCGDALGDPLGEGDGSP